jgi:uncharacterized membrane protein YozB (DUF420 family)
MLIMNLYLEPSGFLGTGASLLADIALIVYILLIVPGMLIGTIFARRRLHRPHHKYTMTAITVINWVFILFLMLAAFTFDITGNIGQQAGNARYLLPAVHAVLGLPAQLLATYVIIRMFQEDAQVAAARKRGETEISKYWFKRARGTMRLTLALWLATAVIGIGNYMVRYGVIPGFNLGGAPGAPIATEAVTAPPPEPAATENAQPPDPAETVEPPAATAEAGG